MEQVKIWTNLKKTNKTEPVAVVWWTSHKVKHAEYTWFIHNCHLIEDMTRGEL